MKGMDEPEQDERVDGWPDDPDFENRLRQIAAEISD
jgi:hypothetical protein